MNQVIDSARSGIILVFSCFITILFLVIALSKYSTVTDSYVAASIDKELLLKNAKSPRLIFVGGSNLALGINSADLSHKTNYSVVNMGLHAGLGLSFALNEVQEGIRSGDVIVLSIEHFLDEGNNKLKAQLITNNPSAYPLLNLSFLNVIRVKVAQLQLYVSSAFYHFIGRTKDPNYNRNAFNTWGDLTSHYSISKPLLLNGIVSFPKKDYTNQLGQINRMVLATERKGAKVYFVFPAFSRTAYLRNKDVLEDLEKQYRAHLDCPILNTIPASVFDDRYFFDTVYHLDSLGIQIRTKQLYNILFKGNVIVTEH